MVAARVHVVCRGGGPQAESNRTHRWIMSGNDKQWHVCPVCVAMVREPASFPVSEPGMLFQCYSIQVFSLKRQP